MAIAFIRTQPVSRKTGRSAVGAASYRAGDRLMDERIGQVFDYTRRSGVEHAEILMPEHAGVAALWSREQLWNAAEAAERRKDGRVAREWVGALPAELSKEQRIEASREFAKEMSAAYGVAVDIALHEPGRHGDERNYHVHYLATTRAVVDGELREKASLEKGLDTIHVVQLREVWETTINRALERAGQGERIDMRPYAEQRESAITAGDIIRAAALDREPTLHVGWKAMAMERRGVDSERGTQLQQIHELNHARQQQALERARAEVMARKEQAEAERKAQIDRERKVQEERMAAAMTAVAKTREDFAAVNVMQQAFRQAGAATPAQQQEQIGRWAELAAQPKIDAAVRAQEICCTPHQQEFKHSQAELNIATRNLAAYESAHPYRVKFADHGFLGISLLRLEDKQLSELRETLAGTRQRVELAGDRLQRAERDYEQNTGGRKEMALERANDEAKLQGVANTILEHIGSTPHRTATFDEMEQHLQFVLQNQIIEAQRLQAREPEDLTLVAEDRPQTREYRGGGDGVTEMEALKASMTSEDRERIENYASAELVQGTPPELARDAIEKWMLPDSPAAREYAQEVVDRHERQQERSTPDRGREQKDELER
jgi:MobA/MobL family